MVKSPCMPGRFAALCRQLNDEKRKAVDELGFGNLLHIPSMCIHRMLLEKLAAESYDVMSRSFRIDGHVVEMCTWDVYCILGLLDKGDKIQVSSKRADPKWFSLYRGRGDTAITFKHLEEWLVNGPLDDHFRRMFVLYAIGTILAPCSREYVSSSYLCLVVDISKIKTYNWAQFTLDFLLDKIAKFKENQREGLAGNLAFFQIWFFEHFPVDGKCFNHAIHEHPLIRNWDDTKCLKRAQFEGIRKTGGEKLVIRLEVNGSEAHTSCSWFDEETVDASADELNNCSFENGKFPDNVDKDEKNIDDSCDDEKDFVFDNGVNNVFSEHENFSANGKANQDDSKEDGNTWRTKEELESIKARVLAFEQSALASYSSLESKVQVIDDRTRVLPQMHALMQDMLKFFERDSRPTKSTYPCEEGDNSKPVKKCKKGSNTTKMSCSLKANACNRTNMKQGVKRKKEEVPSPTLVEKVKGRTDRQPSKICRSPFEGIKRKTNVGLDLNKLDHAAIKFIQKELELDADKVLARIELVDLRASMLKPLIRPVNEDGTQKWLNSEVINSYVNILNSTWSNGTKELKYAISTYQCQWLQRVGEEWMKSGVCKKNVTEITRKFCQSFFEVDTVFIPINTNSHWWLCVLNASRMEFQILNSYKGETKYAEITKSLRCGIHSIFEAVTSSPPKLESRWKNCDILSWNVVVIDNIPRQFDACSCGIFVIKYMFYWNGSIITVFFSQEDMETFRKKMPAELLLSPLNELITIRQEVLSMANM